jgi:EpsI family protein
MSTNKKLTLIIFILLLSNIIVPYLFSAIKEIPFDLSKIPVNFEGWHTTPHKVDLFVKNILETDQVYSFLFQKGNTAVTLSIVYYPKGQISFHLPEGCNKGAGEKIISRDSIALLGAWGDSLGNHFLVQDRQRNVRHHAYVFATDQEATGNYFRFRFHLMTIGITRSVQSCALLNMSVRGKDRGMDETVILQEFWRDISPMLRLAMSGKPDKVTNSQSKSESIMN